MALQPVCLWTVRSFYEIPSGPACRFLYTPRRHLPICKEDIDNDTSHCWKASQQHLESNTIWVHMGRFTVHSFDSPMQHQFAFSMDESKGNDPQTIIHHNLTSPRPLITTA